MTQFSSSILTYSEWYIKNIFLIIGSLVIDYILISIIYINKAKNVSYAKKDKQNNFYFTN